MPPGQNPSMDLPEIWPQFPAGKGYSSRNFGLGPLYGFQKVKSKLEIWGKAQRESARRPKSD